MFMKKISLICVAILIIFSGCKNKQELSPDNVVSNYSKDENDNSDISDEKFEYVDLDEEIIPVNVSGQYNELGKEEKLILYFTDIKGNGDNTYTLYGTVFAPYTLSEEQVNKIKEVKKVKLEDKYYTFTNAVDDSSIYTSNPTFEKRYNTNETLSIIKSKNIGYYLFQDLLSYGEQETKLIFNEVLENGAIGQGAVLRAIDDYRKVTVNSDYEIEEGLTIEEWVNNYFEKSLPKSIYNLGLNESYICSYIGDKLNLSLITYMQ